MLSEAFQLLEYQWSEGKFSCLVFSHVSCLVVFINKPAATRPDASDNSMTEATSMGETGALVARLQGFGDLLCLVGRGLGRLQQRSPPTNSNLQIFKSERGDGENGEATEGR